MKKLILALTVLSLSSVSARATPSVVLRASTLCLPSTLQVEGDTAGALSYTWYFFSWVDTSWHVDPDIQGSFHTFTTLPVYSRSYMVVVQASSGLYHTNNVLVCRCNTLSLEPLKISSAGPSSDGYPFLKFEIPSGYQRVTLQVSEEASFSSYKTVSFRGSSYLGNEKVNKILYYRLSGVIENEVRYSKIVDIKNKSFIPWEPATLVVCNEIGQRIKEKDPIKNVVALSAKHAFLIATEGLGYGVYTVVVWQNGECFVIKMGKVQ